MAKTDTGAAELIVARRMVRRSLALGIAALLVAVAALVPQQPDARVQRQAAGALTEHLVTASIAVESVASSEAEFLRLLNDARTANGMTALVENSDIAATSRTWSGSMLKAGAISHDPNLGGIMTQVLPSWTRAGENVGVGYDVANLHEAFWNSSGHRANMLGDYNQVGIGATYGSDGRLWVTFRFAKGNLPAPVTPATSTPQRDGVGIRRDNAYYLRQSLTSGAADITFGYGSPSDQVVMGDWDGDGAVTPGVFRDGTWYLRNSNTSGAADTTIVFGRAGDAPLAGDWDGNGTDTPGVRRGNTFYLRNTNSSGGANITFGYGTSTDKPVTGDW